MGGRLRLVKILLVVGSLGGALGSGLWRTHEAAVLKRRLSALSEAGGVAQSPCAPPALTFIPAGRPPGALLLASWESVGGCGAGAAAGSGAAVRWIGRGVSGGLVHVQCQASYLAVGAGRRNLSTTVQIAHDFTDRWTAGVLIPYLYKERASFPRHDLNLVNQGLGDVGLMVSRKFGSVRASALSLHLGLPTGASEAHWQFGTQRAPLPHDLQLSIGRPSASLVLDHTMDHIWGLTVLGASVSHRGGENRLGNSRAPNASLYGYSGYLLGPFVPAIGLSLTAAAAADLSLGEPLDTPRLIAALNGSVEWSTDWLAILLGMSFPYGRTSAGLSSEPWVLSIGIGTSTF